MRRRLSFRQHSIPFHPSLSFCPRPPPTHPSAPFQGIKKEREKRGGGNLPTAFSSMIFCTFVVAAAVATMVVEEVPKKRRSSEAMVDR